MLDVVIEPRYRWRLPVPVQVDSRCVEAGREFGASPRVLSLLAARHVESPSAIRAFFSPAEAGLHDPSGLPDAAAMLERVRAAVSRGERALVYGDFDADGLTGLSILVLALRRIGIDALPYVPERLDEGHGLSLRAVDRAVSEGRTLIVTADCGTTSGSEIDAARGRGVDVIVTDHHHAATWPSGAVAVVNPERPDSTYPERELTGAGVAWKVATLLLTEFGGGADAAADLVDLALVGTVADVAPVFGENRSIARLGLERFRSQPRPGLAALLRQAGIAPQSLDLEAIAFQIAPRLNAAGRVGEAARAARLLLAEDDADADALAAELEAANRERRELTRSAVAEARALLQLPDLAASEPGLEGTLPLPVPVPAPSASGELPAAILIRGEWPVGIVGLIAGRLAEDHVRPAVVVTNVDPERGLLRASCRSPKGFDLAAALTELSDLFVRHGGHAAAAGFELYEAEWPAFERRFLELAERAELPTGPSQLELDLVMPATEVDYALVRELALLEPFGPGHPAPLFGITGLTVHRARAAAGGHTQLVLKRTPDVLDAIAFRRPDLAEGLREGDRVDVVARVASRRYGGFESLQLEVQDVAPAGMHLVAHGARGPETEPQGASAPVVPAGPSAAAHGNA